MVLEELDPEINSIPVGSNNTNSTKFIRNPNLASFAKGDNSPLTQPIEQCMENGDKSLNSFDPEPHSGKGDEDKSPSGDSTLSSRWKRDDGSPDSDPSTASSFSRAFERHLAATTAAANTRYQLNSVTNKVVQASEASRSRSGHIQRHPGASMIYSSSLGHRSYGAIRSGSTNCSVASISGLSDKKPWDSEPLVMASQGADVDKSLG
ncbi:unnamed protein product [Protopolystoma xenopodis]|uniref:Uncharacterized protein n=1 Tax=Protopolystoma xenopodis TaxID=117903 RepID=A0A3S5CVI0_9PLAT|nr:unnamed protein product [Protopolystoma xenopodis]